MPQSLKASTKMKKTPIGEIPVDWAVVSIGKVASVSNGTTPRKSQRDFWVNGSIPWVASGKINDRKISEATDWITQKALDECSLTLLSPGTILIAMIGQGKTRGMSAILDIEATINQNLACIEPIPSLDALFLLPYLQMHYSRLRGSARGTHQDALNCRIIKDFLIPLPPLPEQKKIAEILGTWDRAIEKTEKLIQAKQKLKKALMQQLLTGKTRLPGYSRSDDRTSYRFFDLPSEWGCPQMRDIADDQSERNRDGRDVTVLTCSKHYGFVDSSKYFGKQVYSEDTSNYKVIRRDWFGFPANHVEEGSIGLQQDHDIGIVSPIYVVFSVNDSVFPEYLYAVFKSETFRHIFAISTNASVNRRGSLRWREFSLIRVPLPDKDEQEAIISVLKTTDKEISRLQAVLSSLQEQKKGLMQKLLTGKVRVGISGRYNCPDERSSE